MEENTIYGQIYNHKWNTNHVSYKNESKFKSNIHKPQRGSAICILKNGKNLAKCGTIRWIKVSKDAV